MYPYYIYNICCTLNPILAFIYLFFIFAHVEARWLSKDFILVLTDAGHGSESLRTWLDAYHGLRAGEKLPRAGRIQAALVLVSYLHTHT